MGDDSLKNGAGEGPGRVTQAINVIFALWTAGMTLVVLTNFVFGYYVQVQEMVILSGLTMGFGLLLFIVSLQSKKEWRIYTSFFMFFLDAVFFAVITNYHENYNAENPFTVSSNGHLPSEKASVWRNYMTFAANACFIKVLLVLYSYQLGKMRSS